MAIGSDIYFVDVNTKIIEKPFSNSTYSKTDVPSQNSIIRIYLDSKQNIWFGAWNGLIYKYNTITFNKEVLD